ncbi:MAG: hypothetical protein ACETWM_03535 [Candidatus Lokiarchaeia archaeon]
MAERVKKLLEKGDELLLFDKYGEAIRCFDEVIQIDPKIKNPLR